MSAERKDLSVNFRKWKFGQDTICDNIERDFYVQFAIDSLLALLLVWKFCEEDTVKH